MWSDNEMPNPVLLCHTPERGVVGIFITQLGFACFTEHGFREHPDLMQALVREVGRDFSRLRLDSDTMSLSQLCGIVRSLRSRDMAGGKAEVLLNNQLALIEHGKLHFVHHS